MNNKTIAKWFSMLMIMMVASISTSFAQKLAIEDFDLAPGKSTEATIKLVNGGKTVYGLQADIELPKGISLEADPAVVDSILADSTNASITSTVNGQTVSIAVYSLTGKAIQSVESLPIVTLKLVAAADYANVNKLSIKNIKFATSNDGSAEVEGEVADAEVNAGVFCYEYPATIDFSAATPVVKGVRAYAKDVKEGETSGVQPVKYWNIAENGNARAAGVFAGSAAFLGSEAYTSSASENVLGLVALWGTKVQYTQDVLLKAGNYTFTIPVVNAGGAAKVAKNLFGFIAADGTEYLAQATAFAEGASNVAVAFTLDADTYGKLSLGYVAANAGAADMPHLFVQNIKIETLTNLALALEGLNEAIAAAKEEVASYEAVRGAAIFMYADAEFEAIEKAIAAAEKAAAEEDVAAVAAATIALNEAVAAFAPVATAPEAGVTYMLAQKSTGSYLSVYSTDEADGVRLSAEAAEFSWTATEGGYYLSNAEGLYVGLLSTNKWTMSAKPEAKAVISVTPVKIADAVYYTLGEANGLIGTEAGATECLANMEQNDNSLWTIVKVVEPEFEGFATGKYFLKNVVTGMYWGAANEWGTTASLIKTPEYVTLIATADGTYNLESQVSNGGNQYYFNGQWMDNGSPLALTIKEAGDNFTISDGTNCFGYDGKTTVIARNLSADAKEALWTIISEADMIASMAEATEANPVNATFYIPDARFGRNNRNSWTGKGGNQQWGDMFGESYMNTLDYGKILDVPNGAYIFTADVAVTYHDNRNIKEYDGGATPTISVNGNTAKFITTKTLDVGEMEKAFADGQCKVTFGVEVTDGKLDINLESSRADIWATWDNFELTYYGPDAEVGSIMFGSLFKQVEDLRASANGYVANPEIPEGIRFNLGAALDETATVANTEEAYNAAIKTLTEAVNAAKALEIAKPVLEEMKKLVEANNVYTAEAYEEYYGKWAAKYEAGTLTYDEAKALQNPSLTTGWHANITVDDLLLSAWDAKAGDWSPYYINTWSVEGDSDGSNFRVPFFEYFTGDAASLGAKTLTATVNGVESGKYIVSALARVRTKNGVAAQDGAAYGITFTANDAEPVSATDGTYYNFNNGGSNFYVKEVQVEANVGTDGVLTVKFDVAAENNISWLSFKNVKYTKVEAMHTIDFSTQDSYPYYRMEGPEGTSFDVADGAMFIENNAERTNPWDLQPFICDWFNLKKGYDYVVRITMKASADGGAQLCMGTWASAMYQQLSFTASEEYEIYEVAFPKSTVESANNDIHILFQGGKFVGKVDIAKVEVYEYAPVPKEFTIDVERNIGMGYEVTAFEPDFTEALAHLGVQNVTDATLVGLNPDGTEEAAPGPGGIDGWCDADGKFVGWIPEGESKICVKFFPSVPTFEICDMNGADAVGATYTVKYALKANGQTAIYTINVKFVDPAVSIEEVETDAPAVRKFIENGKIVIIKNGVKYSVNGSIIK